MDQQQKPNDANWSYSPQDSSKELTNTPQAPKQPDDFEAISWTGSEFLDRHKSSGWYLGLAVFIAIVCAIVYLISKDLVSVAFIAVMGLLFSIIASRKPRQLKYEINVDGIHIGKRVYSFADFKSFSQQREGAIGYIDLLPLKRFHPGISIYFPPQEEQKVFEALSLRIPHEEHNENLIDKLARAIHF